MKLIKRKTPFVLWWDDVGYKIALAVAGSFLGALLVTAFCYKPLLMLTILMGIMVLVVAVWLIYSTLRELIPYLKGYFKMLKNISKLPTTKEEFNAITENLTLAGALEWLWENITNNYNNKVYSGFLHKDKYARHLLLFYKLAYEKYKHNLKNAPLHNKLDRLPPILNIKVAEIELDANEYSIYFYTSTFSTWLR